MPYYVSLFLLDGGTVVEPVAGGDPSQQLQTVTEEESSVEQILQAWILRNSLLSKLTKSSPLQTNSYTFYIDH